MSLDSSPPVSDDSIPTSTGFYKPCVTFIGEKRVLLSNAPPSKPILNNNNTSTHTSSTNTVAPEISSQLASKSSESSPPASDDSALGSSTSNGYYNRITRVFPSDSLVSSHDLKLAELGRQTKSGNGLISSCVRMVMRCFDDLDIYRFDKSYDYMINFISNGINKCSQAVLRPMSIIWPDRYFDMLDQLVILDNFLIDSGFIDKPVNWMLDRGLTTTPSCGQCKEKMNLKYEKNVVRWHCTKTQACAYYYMPFLRPTFFSNYEKISLDKLLFSIYYWATCISGEDLYSKMNIERHVLNSIWRKIQNVCRTALEKSYPRLRLTNVIDNGADTQSPPEPIDLVSIKLNNVYVVCAKHPRSNLVRLGLHIPEVSLYNFVDLTESWFAHGAHVRIAESKFINLEKRRTDLKIDMVSRLEMISKNGRFNPLSAFGYLVCQLGQVLKDFDSSTLSRENLKLVLAEMQWRELYGTTPYDAFVNVISHMSQYGESSEWYSEPADNEEETLHDDYNDEIVSSMDNPIWAEKYFYAQSIDPVDSEGKVICRFVETPKPEDTPHADVRIRCHECKSLFECFDFVFHIIAHVEIKRNEQKKCNKKVIECKHCFKSMKREEISDHVTLFRSQYHKTKFGCKICCIKLDNRSEYLKHMRRLHFEQETPYRCPSCRFCSSFQKDVFIHFQEEHRHSMIVMCPLCLKSFTVAKPKLMTNQSMKELSLMIYEHISKHYMLRGTFICNKCCLVFTHKRGLMKHSQVHHDPVEIRDLNHVKVDPFVVTEEEEEYCVEARPIELFIANKRPNKLLDKTSTTTLDERESIEEVETSNQDDSNVNDKDNMSTEDCDISDYEEPTSLDEKNQNSSKKDSLLDVRGLDNADKFLSGGEANMKVSKSGGISLYGAGSSSSSAKTDVAVTCSSQKLIDYLSKMRRADGVIPNQSVILTPNATPAKCCECFQFITVDHFVATIICRQCRYSTNCPRAATTHNMTKHNKCLS